MYVRVKTDANSYNELGLTVEGACTVLCELESDVQLLENEQPNLTIGSRAIVIPTGDTWIKGPSGHFIKYKGISTVTQ